MTILLDTHTFLWFIEDAPEHVFRTSHLTLHHRDPFDRLIAAQCIHEDLPLVSVDGVLDSYGVQRLW